MLTAVLVMLGGIVVVLLITVATGYFVAQEFAYMAVDRSRLRSLTEAGDARARGALKVTGRTSFMLSGAQLGITITGLLVGYVAEPLIGRSLSTLLGGIGIPLAVTVATGAVLALLVSTVVQMLFGELFPKNLAISRPEPVALSLARSTRIYLRAFGPLIWFFDQSSNIVLKMVGITPVHDVEHAASARDLEHIVADSRESGELPEDLSLMIDRILDFPRQDVEHAMIPRSQVSTVEDTDTIGEVRELMSHGHTRYPVLSDEPERIMGVVRLVDILTTDLPADAPVTQLVRQPLVVSNLMKLPDVLRELTTSRNQLACVVDEYGGFAGVITMEDLAEELVGEITDEHDPPEDAHEPEAQSEDVWLMAGDVHVDEAERILDVDLPVGDYETIAGLVIAHFGRLPQAGAVVDIELPVDPATLADDEPPPRDTMHVEVREIESYVPAEVQVTITRGLAHREGSDQASPTSGSHGDADADAEGPKPATPEWEEATGWVQR